MQIGPHTIGVCSWSLQPRDAAELVARAAAVGLSHVQLALAPVLALDDAARAAYVAALTAGGIRLTSAMINFAGESYRSIAIIRDTGGYVPDADYPARRDLTLQAAAFAKSIGVTQLSTHIGFVPPSSAARYKTMVDRVDEIAAGLAEHGVDLLMETGQETAPELLKFLNDLRARNVHVNFDPANMLLYGAGDPIDAVRTLGRHIRHVHIKDANMSQQPGMTWGDEVPFGMGQVDPKRFLKALRDVEYAGPLVIEREAGNARVADVKTAIESIKSGIV